MARIFSYYTARRDLHIRCECSDAFAILQKFKRPEGFNIQNTTVGIFWRFPQNSLLQIFFYSIYRFVVGPSERLDYKVDSTPEASTPTCSKSDGSSVSKPERRIKSKNQFLNACQNALDTYKQIIDKLKAQYKHLSCPHPHSCAHYVLSVSIIISSEPIIKSI